MPLAGIRRRLVAALAVLFGIGLTAWLVAGQSFTASAEEFDNEVSRMGHAMLDTGMGGYALPFEAVSLLLLAAMVGCIVIAMKDGGKEKINSAATAAATEQNQQ
jgi:NADH-quinone oxidoreductase subunit J